MPEIRASALVVYADDEHGVLRPVTRLVPANAEFVSGKLKARGDVLILELYVFAQ